MTYKPLAEIDQWLKENKSVVVMMGHIGNWEWTGHFISYLFPGKMCALYRRIKNKRVEQWMLRRRKSSGARIIEMDKTTELVRLITQESKLVLMLSDQNPGREQGIIWVPFLQKETAFVSGAESLSAKFNLPVVFAKTLPIGSANYVIEFEIIHSGVEKLPKGEITARYARLLEQNIHQYKTGWLWSHRRWKRKPPGMSTLE
jgi:KDO2-lipid IV(A) lauroyltransferase